MLKKYVLAILIIVALILFQTGQCVILGTQH